MQNALRLKLLGGIGSPQTSSAGALPPALLQLDTLIHKWNKPQSAFALPPQNINALWPILFFASCHSAGSLGWPFPMLKYNYIFSNKIFENNFIKQHSETVMV